MSKSALMHPVSFIAAVLLLPSFAYAHAGIGLRRVLLAGIHADNGVVARYRYCVRFGDATNGA